jgi:hypothetical protein
MLLGNLSHKYTKVIDPSWQNRWQILHFALIFLLEDCARKAAPVLCFEIICYIRCQLIIKGDGPVGTTCMSFYGVDFKVNTR